MSTGTDAAWFLLIDSKVVVGAMAKGRSGSPQLNGFLRRVAALCFSGGLSLSVVYIPTEFNPADFPSRGLAIPRRWQRGPSKLPQCPSCGLRPHEHPGHVLRSLRGTGLSCRVGLGHAFLDGSWVLALDTRLQTWIDLPSHANDELCLLQDMRHSSSFENLDWSDFDEHFGR